MITRRWAITTVGAALHIRYGKALPADARDPDGPFPVLGSAGYMTGTYQPLISVPVVLIGRKGNVGEARLERGGCWPIDTTYYAEIPENLDSRFLLYQLQHLDLRRLDSSTATPSLRRQDLEAQTLVIPAMSEQRRIVEILEDHLSRIDAAERELRKAATRLDALASSALQEEWANGKSWVSLEQVGTVLTGSTPKQSTARDSVDLPFVTPGDVGAGNLIPAAARSVAVSPGTPVRRTGGKAALVVCIGATLGKSGWTESDVTFNQQLNAVVCHHHSLDAELLAALLAAPSGQAALRAEASATTMPILNKRKFARVRVPDLDAAAADRARRRLHLLRESCPRARDAASLQLLHASGLRRALLSAAFSGQLTGRHADGEILEELAGA